MTAAGMQTKATQGQADFKCPSQSSCRAGLSPTTAKCGRQTSLPLTGGSLHNERDAVTSPRPQEVKVAPL